MEIDSKEPINEDMESDQSDEDEKLLEFQVLKLENMIAENKFSYQPYIDLINTFKSLADLDRLRLARKRMAHQFPLSPELWLDWLQDEINLATSNIEKEKIVELFQAAVKDYLSVEIWLLYTTYYISFQNEKDSSDVTSIRSVFENALTAAGLHVTKGASLWESYIEYEKSSLSNYLANSIDYKNKLKYIANLYKRQVSCPLLGMEKTYNNFKNWLESIAHSCDEKIIDEKVVENIFKKSQEKLSKILPFEEALISNLESSFDVWKNYIAFEKSKEGSPVRVQCLYERFLCENCLNEEMWLEYIDYVDKVLRNFDVLVDVCKRAVKNCPWCCKIYRAYIICLEKYGKPQKDITEIVEEAFASGLQTASDFRDIWLAYLEYLRRNFDSSESKEEEEKKLEGLKTAFSKAVDFLTQMPDADPEYSVLQFWARIEAIYCKNMDKTREIWNVILADEKCKTSEMWLEYIHLERAFGDSKHLRKLFPRALQSTFDWPEAVGKAWLNYERDEGTLESFQNCVQKIGLKTKEIIEKREKLATEIENDKPVEHSKKRFKIYDTKKKNENIKSNSLSVKGNKKRIGFKRQNEDEEDSFSSPTKKQKKNDEVVEKEKSNDDLVTKLLEESKKKHGETVMHISSKDHRTVFVSNLDFSIEEDKIRDVFSPCGNITDLRLVRDYKGRSKGFCYVEFEKSSEAQKALQKDRELIHGRPMFVSKCDPDKETRSSGFKYSSGMEKNKLFLRDLPFSVTMDDLRTLFSKFGTVKDVRIVTYRNGHSKGLAYVEFEDEASAAQAVLSTDGTVIEGKQISVAISNPPGRKMETQSSKTVFSLGGGSKEVGPRGRSKTQISFVPRALSLSKPNTPAESFAHLSLKTPNSANENKKLNNSDFRKLLN